jgi:hypothetical protein
MMPTAGISCLYFFALLSVYTYVQILFAVEKEWWYVQPLGGGEG